MPIHYDEQWDQTDSYYYNGLFDITIEPTRYMYEDTLKQLGVYDDVDSLLFNSHLWSFASMSNPFYPNLAWQCLASAKLTFAYPRKPVASEAIFSFFVGGRRCAIDMSYFYHLYGFQDDKIEFEFPKWFPIVDEFWRTIAFGRYESRSANQALIRHPVVRACAKIFSNMLLVKDGLNKVRQDELLMLYYGCGDVVANSFGGGHSVENEVHLGIFLD